MNKPQSIESCLEKTFGHFYRSRLHEMRETLGLSTGQKFNISHLPKLEKILIANIYVKGEYEHDKKYSMTCYMKMKDEQFSIDKKRSKDKLEEKVAGGDKPFLIFDDNKTQCYDGKTLYENKQPSEFEGYHWIKMKKLVEMTKIFYDKKDVDIKDVYNFYVDQANKLKDLKITSKDIHGFGLSKPIKPINLFLTGSINKTVRKYVYHEFNKLNCDTEEITEDEYEWLENATKNQIYKIAKNGTYETVYGYDQNNSYNSQLIDPKFYIPVKQGKFKHLSNDDFMRRKNFNYGIYRCIVEFNEDFKNQFRYNRTNHYTHFTLEIAKQLNLKITMIEDDKPNVLEYSCKDFTCVKAHRLFYEYITWVNYMKKFKKEIPLVKLLNSGLWGCLCEAIIKKEKKTGELIYNSYEDMCNAIEEPDGDGYYTRVETKSYKTPLARLKPFLLSRQCLTMFDVINEHYDTIVRFNTDGFASTEKIRDLDIGEKIGQWKFEGVAHNQEIKIGKKIEWV
jgi:hypothetical protein